MERLFMSCHLAFFTQMREGAPAINVCILWVCLLNSEPRHTAREWICIHTWWNASFHSCFPLWAIETPSFAVCILCCVYPDAGKCRKGLLILFISVSSLFKVLDFLLEDMCNMPHTITTKDSLSSWSNKDSAKTLWIDCSCGTSQIWCVHRLLA